MKSSETAFSIENAPVFAGVYSGYAPVGGGEGHCTLQWHRDDTHTLPAAVLLAALSVLIERERLSWEPIP